MDSTGFSPTIALLTLARAAEVDVARILEKLLHVNLGITKGGPRFSFGRLDSVY